MTMLKQHPRTSLYRRMEMRTCFARHSNVIAKDRPGDSRWTSICKISKCGDKIHNQQN